MSKVNLNIVDGAGQLRSWIDGIGVYDNAGDLRTIREGDFVYNAAGDRVPILREDTLSLGMRTSGATMTAIYSYNNTLLNNPKIVIMGSSTAAGYGLSSTQTIQYKIQQYANANWGGATINNIAIAGQWSTNWLPTAQGGTVGSNIDAALAYEPDFILHMGPTNNAEHMAVDWQADLQTIITYAQQRGVRMILMSPMPRSPYNLTQQQFLSDSAAQLLAAFPYLMFNTFDSDVRRKDTSNPAEGNPIYFQADTFHLNDLGTTYVTDNFIIPFIEKQFRANTAYQNFIIEKSADGSTGWSVFDTITDQQVTRKSYTKEPGYYRATATLKDGSTLAYSNVQQVTNSAPTANAGSDQNPTAGTTSIDITGSGSDPDGTITGYLWEVVSGSGLTLVNATSPTVTVNGLADGETYQLRLTVTDNNGATGTDLVTITVAEGSGFVPYRILIDLGGNGTNTLDGTGAPAGVLTASPDGMSPSKYWNNLYGFANGDGFRDGYTQGDLVDTNNVNRGLIFTVVTNIYGTFFNASYNTRGINMTGTNAAVGDYPASACNDSAFGNTSAADNGAWKLEGLDPANTYSFKFWGARATPSSSIVQIKTSTQDWAEAQEYNGLGNTDYNNAAVISGVTGVTEVTFNIRVKPSSGASFCHIGIIDTNVTRP